MATYDVSFLNPKFKKSSGGDYNFLVDQLSIKENQLASDGKLSPGDYNYLVGEAQKLSTHPGLTPDQRSNISVKISGWQKSAKTTNLGDSQDLTRLNNETKDDNLKASMLLAGNPSAFLKAGIATTRAKLTQLAGNIDSLTISGGDSSAQSLEYANTMNSYNDLLSAQNDVETYLKSPTGKPTSQFAAFINTNSKGEVTGINIDRSGNKSGYAQTYGLYGGLPIYGNAKLVDGKQVFKLGNQTFSAVNVLTPDPNNPGSFTTKPLSAEQNISGMGSITMAARGGYVDVDSKAIRSQTLAPAGSYVKGSKGFIYQANSDGTYKKIVNSNASKLGLTDQDIPSVPADYEKNFIMPRTSETIDASLPPPLPSPPATSGPMSGPAAPAGPAATPAPSPQANMRPAGPSAPTANTPASSPQSVAKNTQSGAVGFLQRLFGK